jgi:beta-lactamase superfamily II metal-dependent hydrolase
MTSSPKAVILDVGHGNCAVVADRDSTVVIDAALGGVLLDFLKAQSLSEIDYVLVSHADSDHIGGLIALLSSEEIFVKSIYLNPDPMRTSKIWGDLKCVLKDARRRRNTEIKNGLSTTIPGRLATGELVIEVVAPSPEFALTGVGGTTPSEQNVSAHSLNAVVRLLHGDKAVALFCGDLDEVGLAEIQNEGVTITAEVLVFPHHGGLPGKAPDAFTTTLCQMVKPRVVVFSIGRGKHGTPRPEIVAALRRIVPEAHIACTQLSERCAPDLPATTPSHLVNEVGLGREKNSCCAGTLIIFPPPLSPTLRDHRAFVSIAAPTALCQGPVAPARDTDNQQSRSNAK